MYIRTYEYMYDVCMNVHINFFCWTLAVTKYPPNTYSQPTTNNLTLSHASGLQNCNIYGTLVTEYEYIFYESLCSLWIKNKIKPFKIKTLILKIKHLASL